MDKQNYLKVLFGMVICLFFLMIALQVEATDPGVTKDSVLVGGVLDTTGPVAFWGKSAAIGMTTWIQYINDQGGVHGRKINYLYESDEYNPTKSVAAVKKLVFRDQVFCISPTMGTAHTSSVIPILQEEKVPLVGMISAGTALVHPPKKYIFSIYQTNVDRNRVQVDYLVKHLKMAAPKVGYIYQDDEFGLDDVSGAVDQLKKYGLELAGQESYKRGALEFGTQVLKLRKMNPNVVFINGFYRECASVIKEMDKIGWKPELIMISGGAADKKFVDLAGPLSEGVFTSFWMRDVEDDRPAILEFRKLLNKYHPNTEPANPQLMGYTTAKFLVEGLRLTGPDLTRENLVKGIETIKDFDTGIGAKISFRPNVRNGSSGSYIAQVKKGKFVPLTNWLEPEK